MIKLFNVKLSKAFLIFFIVSNSSSQLFAQTTPPAIQWKKCYGSYTSDYAHSIQQTIDGGYIVAGEASSNGGDVTDNHGYSDFWVVKLSATGTIEWQKCYGGSNVDIAYSIMQTKDSGYIVCGSTISVDGDVTGFTPDPYNPLWGDYWIIKITKTGVLQWQKTIGGGKLSFAIAYSVIQTNDNGYLVSGYNYKGNSGDFANGTIVKLSETGDIQWQTQSYNGFDNSVKQTTDKGYILCGGGGQTLNIQKIDSLGNHQWSNYYGGVGYVANMLYSILQTPDGGYIAVGGADSTDTLIKGNHGGVDVFIIKVDSAGTMQWQKCYGGSKIDYGYAIQPTADGNYIIAGKSASTNGDVLNVNPITINWGGGGWYANYWIFKINSTGNLLWQKTIGGSNEDNATAIQQTKDGGYIVAGYVTSDILPNGDGDIKNTGAHFGTFIPPGAVPTYDFFVVKFAKEAQAVPINLVSFTAKVIDKNAQLSWTTNNEINNQSFDIEKSIDGIHFATIANIKANISSNTVHQYSYSDNTVNGLSMVYYRIKQIDNNGVFTYSDIKSLHFNQMVMINIYPNPAKDFIQINLPSATTNYQIIMYNNIGAVVKKMEGKIGINTLFTKDYIKGVYQLKIMSNNEEVATKKIIIN